MTWKMITNLLKNIKKATNGRLKRSLETISLTPLDSSLPLREIKWLPKISHRMSFLSYIKVLRNFVFSHHSRHSFIVSISIPQTLGSLRISGRISCALIRLLIEEKETLQLRMNGIGENFGMRSESCQINSVAWS